MILAIETATDVCGAALVHQKRVLASSVIGERNLHSEKLMPMVDDVVRRGGPAVTRLDGIAVSIGPGSFTGLRIGLSTAKGLALGMGLPLLPVPTLDALAFQGLRLGSTADNSWIVATIDAKRGEAFYGIYRIVAGVLTAAVDCTLQPYELIGAEVRARAPVIVIGDAATSVCRTLGDVSGITDRGDICCHPEAVGLVAEREGRPLLGAEFAELEPLYLRDFEATRGSAVIERVMKMNG